MPQSVVVASGEIFQPPVQVAGRDHSDLAELPAYELPARPATIGRGLPVVVNVVIGALHKKFEPSVRISAHCRGGSKLPAQRLPLVVTKSHNWPFSRESLQSTKQTSSLQIAQNFIARTHVRRI